MAAESARKTSPGEVLMWGGAAIILAVGGYAAYRVIKGLEGFNPFAFNPFGLPIPKVPSVTVPGSELVTQPTKLLSNPGSSLSNVVITPKSLVTLFPETGGFAKIYTPPTSQFPTKRHPITQVLLNA